MEMVFERVGFSVKLAFKPLAGELAEIDRQFAWEFYLELVTRLALCGKLDAEGKNESFHGELLSESLESVRVFSEEVLTLLRQYPVGKLAGAADDHLGFFMARVLELVIRPFLEKWHVHYLQWWRGSAADGGDAKPYRHQRLLVEEWACIRKFSRAVIAQLQESYGFVPLRSAVPPHVRADWVREAERLFGDCNH